MAFERGWKAVQLEMTDAIPHTEFVDHDEFIRVRAGIDTRIPEQRPMAWPALARALDFDFVWNTCEAPLARGRITSLGHAVWSETDGLDGARHCPFTDVAEVLALDPVEEYGIPPHDELVRLFQANQDACKSLYPGAVFPGGRYHSLFSACIRSFGWEMFMAAAHTDPIRFAKMLDGFAEITRAEIRAWLATDMRVFLMHDDIAWTQGPVFAPEWYRAFIFPKYKAFWKMIHEAGRRVIFCSDGNYVVFIDDLARAGADGFVFEPATPLEHFTEKYGRSHILIGGVDCRVLQYGGRGDIRREVERCVRLGRGCPGYFMCAGNHIPNGIPLENLDCYLGDFESMRAR